MKKSKHNILFFFCHRKRLRIFITGLFIAFYTTAGFAQWNTDRIMTIGRNALYFEDYVLAIQYFNQVISVKPYLAEPYMYRGMAKAQLADYKGADNDCTEAINRNPFIPQAYYTRGYARRKLGYYQDAIDDFTKALEFSPNSSFLLLNRMDAKAGMENYEDALTDLETYMAINPKMKELYYEKGRLQLALNDTIAAEKTFDHFVEIDSKNSLAWSARGLLHLQKKELDEALNSYNKAIELKSNFEGDFINRGIINVQKNNFRQALSDYDSAIKLDKNNTLAYYNRALLRSNLGDTNNALDDIAVVLQLDSTYMEARLQKAILEASIGNLQESTRDYKIIINKYPDFIPAYVGISENENKRGKKTESMRYYQMALDIQEKMKNRTEKEKTIVAENKIDEEHQQGSSGQRREMFNRYTAQNMERAEKESKYDNEIRGNIQNKYTEVVNERNFIMSYYAHPEDLRRTNYYHPIIDAYNKEKKLNTIVKITNNEIALTEEMVNAHFNAIDDISTQLTSDTNDPDVFYKRALEFALIQDFNSAIKDLDKAIMLRPDFTLAYFTRANIRNKQIEYANNTEDDSFLAESSNDKKSSEKQYNYDAEMIMRDYNKVIELSPDFQFAYFNKGNLLATLNELRAAITNYTKAITIDPDFAEAYFNRGLIYLFLEEDAKGLADLSKAGELGMYKSYNLIQRFNQ